MAARGKVVRVEAILLTKDAEAGIKRLGASIRKAFGTDLKGLATTTEKALDRLAGSAKKTKTYFDGINLVTMKELGDEAQKASVDVHKLATGTKDLSSETKKLKVDTGKLKVETKQLSAEMKVLGIAGKGTLRILKTGVTSAKVAWRSFRFVIASTLGVTRSLYTNMLSFRTLFLGGAFVTAFAPFARFERDLANVATLTSQTTEELAAARDRVFEVAKSTGQAFEPLLKSLYDLVSAGRSAQESMVLIETAAKLAEGGVTTASNAVSALNTVINVYNLDVEEATDVSDAFFSAVRKGVTTVERLSLNVGKVLPVARQLGVGFDEVLAALAALTKGGLDTEQAATALRQIFLALVSPSQQAAQAAQDLGVELGSAAVTGGRFLEFFQNLNDQTGGSAEQLSRLFENVRALNGVSILAADRGRLLADSLQAMGNRAGETEQAFGKMQQTLDVRFRRTLRAAEEALVRIGQGAKPGILRLLDDITAGFEGIDAEKIGAVLSKIVDIIRASVRAMAVAFREGKLPELLTAIFVNGLEQIARVFLAGLPLLLSVAKRLGIAIGTTLVNSIFGATYDRLGQEVQSESFFGNVFSKIAPESAQLAKDIAFQSRVLEEGEGAIKKYAAAYEEAARKTALLRKLVEIDPYGGRNLEELKAAQEAERRIGLAIEALKNPDKVRLAGAKSFGDELSRAAREELEQSISAFGQQVKANVGKFLGDIGDDVASEAVKQAIGDIQKAIDAPLEEAGQIAGTDMAKSFLTAFREAVKEELPKDLAAVGPTIVNAAGLPFQAATSFRAQVPELEALVDRLAAARDAYEQLYRGGADTTEAKRAVVELRKEVEALVESMLSNIEATKKGPIQIPDELVLKLRVLQQEIAVLGATMPEAGAFEAGFTAGFDAVRAEFDDLQVRLEELLALRKELRDAGRDTAGVDLAIGTTTKAYEGQRLAIIASLQAARDQGLVTAEQVAEAVAQLDALQIRTENLRLSAGNAGQQFSAGFLSTAQSLGTLETAGSAAANGLASAFDLIGDAARGASINVRAFIRDFLADMAVAIIRALILKAITDSIGGGSGRGAAAGGSVGSAIGAAISGSAIGAAGASGAIGAVGRNRGGLIPSGRNANAQRLNRGGSVWHPHPGRFVPGPRVNRDVVNAKLTPGEYVWPVDAVEHFGMRFMELGRKKLLPKREVYDALSGVRMAGKIQRLNDGGPVGVITRTVRELSGNGGGGGDSSPRSVPVMRDRDYDQHIRQGRRAVWETLESEGSRLRGIMNRRGGR